MKYRDPITGDFKEIYVKVSDTLPVGAICQYGGTTAPSGYLMCNGQSVSRLDYAELFAAIGTTFGSGDGVTTFNLPNFNGRVPVGLDGTDTDFDTIGETGGSKYLQEHSHKFKVNASFGTPNNTSGGYMGGVAGNLSDIVGDVDGVTTGNSGNLQPYLVTNFIIKASKKVALDKGNVVDSLNGSDTDSAPSVRAVKSAILDVQDISSLITKSSNVGAVYNMNAYKKGNRCYLNATIDYYNGAIFNIDSSLTPKYSEIAIGNNYSTGDTKNSTISISANNLSINANTFGTSNPYLAFHIEWEI